MYGFLIVSLYQVPFEIFEFSGTFSKLMIVLLGILSLLSLIFEKNKFHLLPGILPLLIFISVTFIHSLLTSSTSAWISLVLPIFMGYILYILLINHQFTPKEFNGLLNFMFTTMLLQIVASVIKVVSWGVFEKSVGTIHYLAGGLNTILPLCFIAVVLSLFLIYKRKVYYLYLIPGFLFMAWAGDKRGIYFYLPVVLIMIYTFYSFYEKGKIGIRFLIRTFVLVVVPTALIFYLGVRMHPTLNRENDTWGKFDLEYVLDYATVYSTGYTQENLAGGRFASYNEILANFAGTKEIDKFLFGYGSDKVIGVKESEFYFFRETFNVSQSLALSGFTTFLISHGVLGIVALLFFFYSIIKTAFSIQKVKPQNRFHRALNFAAIIITLVYMLDFFTYSKSTITVYGTLVIFFFIHGISYRMFLTPSINAKK